jgi:hypothetical protein
MVVIVNFLLIILIIFKIFNTLRKIYYLWHQLYLRKLLTCLEINNDDLLQYISVISYDILIKI